MVRKDSTQDKVVAGTAEVGEGSVLLAIDKEAERSYVKKLDFCLLPFLSLCYFFSAVDRVRHHSCQLCFDRGLLTTV